MDGHDRQTGEPHARGARPGRLEVDAARRSLQDSPGSLHRGKRYEPGGGLSASCLFRCRFSVQEGKR